MTGKNLLIKAVKNQRGITIIELLVGAALLSMVLAVGYSFFSFGHKSFTMGESRSLVRQNIRLAADFITKELRYATHVYIIDHVPDAGEFNSDLNYIYIKDGILRHKEAGGNEETVFNSISEGVMLKDLVFTLEDDNKFLHYEIKNNGEDDYSIDSKLSFLNQLAEVSDATTGIAIAYKSLSPEPGPDDDFLEIYPDVFVPNVPITPGEIMVFKEGEYVLITADELKKPHFNSEDYKIEGSLYIPESTGEILVSGYWPTDETIDWTVTGDIIVGADINITKWTKANMVSKEGDIIFLSGSKFHGRYIMDIRSEQGAIKVDGTELGVDSGSDSIIRLAAKEDISLTNTKITSPGSYGVVITSDEGRINADGANIAVGSGSNAIVNFNSKHNISMKNGVITSSGDKGVLINTAESFDCSGATITSTNGAAAASIIVTTAGDIKTDGATIRSSGSGTNTIALLSGGYIYASGSNMEATNDSSNVTIKLEATQDIHIEGARISSKGKGSNPLTFRATGAPRKLYVQGATVTPAKAYNLAVDGVLGGGSIN